MHFFALASISDIAMWVVVIYGIGFFLKVLGTKATPQKDGTTITKLYVDDRKVHQGYQAVKEKVSSHVQFSSDEESEEKSSN